VGWDASHPNIQVHPETASRFVCYPRYTCIVIWAKIAGGLYADKLMMGQLIRASERARLAHTIEGPINPQLGDDDNPGTERVSGVSGNIVVITWSKTVQ
jgi:hypothetical protein